MIIPTDDSMNQVIQEILDKDYVEHPEEVIKGELEYPEEIQMDVPMAPTKTVLSSNYIEISKPMQSLYESQFRSFSSKKDKQDSFEELI